MDVKIFEKTFDQLLLESEDENFNDETDKTVVFGHELDFESDGEDVSGEEDDDSWSETLKDVNNFEFSDNSGLNWKQVSVCENPIDFYLLFLNQNLVELILLETNKYAAKKNLAWTVLTPQEFLKFLVVCIQMDLEQRPTLSSYWSTSQAYSTSFAAGFFTKNRFLEILTGIHLADNDEADKTDKLFKISKFIELFNETCEEVLRPSRDLFIGESAVPFWGRIIFREYAANQIRENSLKMFQLCSETGYTFRTMVCVESKAGSVSEDAVFKLMDGYLNFGRRLFTTKASLSMAEKLIEHKTHLIGRLNRNQPGIPRTLLSEKLKNGSTISKQNDKGLTMIKLKNKKEMLFLSTQTNESAVTDFNRIFDASTQKLPHTPFITKTTKWYLRLFFHFLIHTAVNNAWRIFVETKESISLVEFKTRIIEGFAGVSSAEFTPSHILEEVAGFKRKTRRRCVYCYERIRKETDSVYARNHARQVHTKCSSCHKFMCLYCFQTKHSKCSV